MARNCIMFIVHNLILLQSLNTLQQGRSSRCIFKWRWTCPYAFTLYNTYLNCFHSMQDPRFSPKSTTHTFSMATLPLEGSSTFNLVVPLKILFRSIIVTLPPHISIIREIYLLKSKFLKSNHLFNKYM